MKTKPHANRRSPASSGYAVGDRVEVIKKTIWGCQTGTVHWCNSQWMNVRLDNNKAILSLHVSDVKQPPASAAPLSAIRSTTKGGSET